MRWAAITPLPTLFAAGLGSACSGDRVEPAKVSELEPAVEPKVRPQRSDRFRDPNAMPPKVRRGSQLDSAALTAAVRKANEHRAGGRVAVAIETLHACANRIPQSVECEGELALILFAHRTRLAEAKYYLDEAAIASPATASVDLYRRMGHVAVARARFDAARAALGVVTADPGATSNDFIGYARALRRGGNRLDEAAAAYERAYELDPANHELLEDRATLHERAGDHARALELLDLYITAMNPEGRKQEILRRRRKKLAAKSSRAGAAKTPPR